MYSLSRFDGRRSFFFFVRQIRSSSQKASTKDLLNTKQTTDHIRSALYPLTVADYPKQVLPDLHLKKIFHDIDLLRENCEQRNLKVDVDQLASDYQRWEVEKNEFRRLRDLNYVQEKLRENNSNENKEKILDEEEFQSLKKQYDNFREGFRLFDQRFLVDCLHLPAGQHVAVPNKPSNGVTVFESSRPIVKHAFNSKTWNELCHVEQNDVSIFARYWLGVAPLRKHQFVDFVCTELINLGFQEMSSISMTKPFIQEALGANINESRHVLTTFANPDDPQSRSLISAGLGAFASILVPFIRRTIVQNNLPYFVFTQGACYEVDEEQTYRIQLLAMTDVSAVDLKTCSNKKNSSNIFMDDEKNFNSLLNKSLENKEAYRFRECSRLDELFLELNRLMFNLYEKFRMPYRIRNCSSDKLRAYELMRLDYEIFLPSSNCYVRVGSVSLIGDYLSRRLMIRQKRTKKEKSSKFDDDIPRETNFNYVQMIHVQVVDVDMLTKCYVEKDQRSFSQNKPL